MDRESSLTILADGVHDILVVGGGIVGAGTARDAALRGLSVAVVDRFDFAFGTSGRSSRLLHGGLRYLEQGDIALVHEASREKTLLHEIAPHLAQPLGFIFPAWKHKGRPLWQLFAGVKLYDLLCHGKKFGSSRRLTVSELLERLPGLDQEDLSGAVRYYDAFTNDARLVIDTLRSAANAGAIAANYLMFTSARREDGLWLSTLQDRLSGSVITVTSRCIVSATGPWGGDMPHHELPLHLTKGVHVVVSRDRFHVPDAVVMPEGKRILFAIPWGERTILGTTDTAFSGLPEDVQTTPADIQSILGVVNRYFPSAGLTAGDVLADWAGLRPLIRTSSAENSEISRRHQIIEPRPGWIEVGGGKLTTYRIMAEQIVNRLRPHLGRDMASSISAKIPLLSPSQVTGISSLIPPPLTPELVDHYCNKEWALRLDDILQRRTKWAQYGMPDPDMISQVAEWMARSLNWEPGRWELERDYYQTLNMRAKPGESSE
jgi:glycerol-3-phosphate dehydrogenase